MMLLKPDLRVFEELFARADAGFYFPYTNGDYRAHVPSPNLRPSGDEYAHQARAQAHKNSVSTTTLAATGTIGGTCVDKNPH